MNLVASISSISVLHVPFLASTKNNTTKESRQHNTKAQGDSDIASMIYIDNTSLQNNLRMASLKDLF